MNFKKINKHILFTLFIFLFSCKSLEIIPNKKNIKTASVVYDEIHEVNDSIDLNYVLINNKNYRDFYDNLNITNWNNNKKFVKLKTYNSFGKKYVDSRPLESFIYEDKIISLDHKSYLKLYDLTNISLLDSINLQLNFDKDISFPTSLAIINDKLYASYSDGKIVCFNLDGSINWKKNFVDIIKTPIKIYNNNLIILLSNKIISINSENGDINWEFLYESNNSLQSLGGDILNINHLLFFILPNNIIGEVDTIFGEKNSSLVSNIGFPNNSVKNISDKLNSYKNILSYFYQKKYLTSIDINNNKILINNNIINNVKSFVFFNNSLITLNDNFYLKSYNLINGNLFWKKDLSKVLDKKAKIIAITNFTQSLIVFFNNGQMIEFNSLNGNIISYQNLNINNIIKIRSEHSYLFVNQANGKTTIFTQ